MKKLLSIILLVTIVCCGTQVAYAQKKNPSSKKEEIHLPKVITLLGNYRDSAKVSTEEGAHLIALPLRIVDDKQNLYAIYEYQFLYKRKGQKENEVTGKTESIFTTSSAWFDQTPLPKIWIDNIKEKLQSGEELYFFDVLVKDSKGIIFFAPNIKITIQ
jgi:hypothetical protein